VEEIRKAAYTINDGNLNVYVHKSAEDIFNGLEIKKPRLKYYHCKSVSGGLNKGK